MPKNLSDVLALFGQLGLSHLTVGALALAAGAYLKPQLEAALKAMPNWLATRAKAKFDADVAAGRIPPAVARLLGKLKRAVLDWADEELPDALGADKMAAALAALERLPYLGRLVAADPSDVQRELEIEYAAVRAEIKAEEEAAKKKEADKPDAPPPAPNPNPAPAAPVGAPPAL